MSEASEAFAEAERRVAEAFKGGATELDLSDLKHLEELPSDIAKLAGLVELRLGGPNTSTNISNITPLQNLTVLQRLNLQSTKVADATPLQTLIALKILDLSKTQISDITKLQSLGALEALYLNGTLTTDFSPLKNLATLQILDLGNAQITDIWVLKDLSSLQVLNLNNTKVKSVTPLVNLTMLRELDLDNTPIADYALLKTLPALEYLDLENTQVSDLRPLLEFPTLTDQSVWSRFLVFRNTPATAGSAELKRLSQIDNTSDRLDQTLAFLRTLPPYPKPLPWETPSNATRPTEIPKAPIKVITAQTQINFVLEHAVISQATALQTASQIRFALRDVPATDGNRLPPVLQSMENVAAIFERLGAPPAPGLDPESDLKTKIAALEAEVAELTVQLADETKAKEAAEALLKKDGVGQNYKKALGTKAGEVSVTLPRNIGIATLIYYLGANHPAVVALLKALGS